LNGFRRLLRRLGMGRRGGRLCWIFWVDGLVGYDALFFL
jgi:hypothetical protein